MDTGERMRLDRPLGKSGHAALLRSGAPWDGVPSAWRDEVKANSERIEGLLHRALQQWSSGAQREAQASIAEASQLMDANQWLLFGPRGASEAVDEEMARRGYSPSAAPPSQRFTCHRDDCPINGQMVAGVRQPLFRPPPGDPGHWPE